MYKTKLQELCHQKRWSLPCYSTMKDGPDHSPRFKASVSVNGLSFHSHVSCISSKHSQNDAAMQAFIHFTSPRKPGLSVNEPLTDQGSEVNLCSSISSAEPTAGGPKIEETSQGLEIHSQASDVQFQYKNQLQNHARRKNLDSPVYSSIREGPAHVPRFKATVTVDGHTFDSLQFFTNLKQAEHAAAKVALMSLSSDGFHLEGLGFYKNLLQELCQREGLSRPIYRIIKSGASHMPTFFSSVVVEDEVFYGKAGRSKKEAEIKAAKLAYTVFIDRRQSRSVEHSSPTSEEDRTPKSTVSDVVVTVESQNVKQKCEWVSSPATTFADDIKEVQEVNSAEIVASNAKASSDDSTPSPLIPCMDELTGSQDTLSSIHAPASTERDSLSAPPVKHPNISALSISDSSTRRATGKGSYLLCNRVRVYPCIPDIAFPKGITVLPMSNDKWVAVSLEFPNESN